MFLWSANSPQEYLSIYLFINLSLFRVLSRLSADGLLVREENAEIMEIKMFKSKVNKDDKVSVSKKILKSG